MKTQNDIQPLKKTPGDKTVITFSFELPYKYDLELDEYRRSQMLNEHIPKNVNKFGSLDQFYQILAKEADEIERQTKPKLMRWHSLIEQMKFITKVSTGEITQPEQEAQTDGV